MSASGGVLEVSGFWAGVWPLLSSCWMTVCERKVWRSGDTLASLSDGLSEMIMFRRDSNDFSTMGKLDMVVV